MGEGGDPYKNTKDLKAGYEFVMCSLFAFKLAAEVFTSQSNETLALLREIVQRKAFLTAHTEL